MLVASAPSRDGDSGSRRKRNIRTRETSGNSPAPGMHYSGPWNCMWVSILMNEFTKITPVSIGLLVDEQQFLNGITGIRSFSMEYEYKDHSHFWAPFSSQFAELNRDFSSGPAPAMPVARASHSPLEQKSPPKNPAGAQKKNEFVRRGCSDPTPGVRDGATRWALCGAEEVARSR